MNIHQCEAKAQQIGYDKARFIAVFPVGPVQCQWLDAYMGILKVDADGLRDGFLTTSQIDRESSLTWYALNLGVFIPQRIRYE